MTDETKKQPGTITHALATAYAAADEVRDKVARTLGFENQESVTRKAFGNEAANLETQSREAAKAGHFVDAAVLGVKSMGEGLHDMVHKGAMQRMLSGGHDVEAHGGAPATPASPASRKDSPKR